MFDLSGVITAIATPMDDAEKINEAELRRQVNRQIDAGVHGLFALGTNGEFYALSWEEKLLVMRAILEETAGRVPVIGGVGCITTRETIALAKEAEQTGLEAITVIVPYFVAVSQDQIYDHFRRVAESVNLPILLYNIPMRTGNSIEIETAQRLAEIPNIVGIKDSSGKMENLQTLIDETPGEFHVYVGTDSLILKTLQAGGRGAVSGCANLFPKLMARIYNSWKKGDLQDATTAQELVNPIRSTFKLGNPNSVVKRTLELLGHPVGPARSPVNISSAEIDEAIRKALETYRE